MNNIIKIIKSEFPDKAKDISESLELLNEAISSTIDDISSELNVALKSRDNVSMDKYNLLIKEGFKYEEIIEEVIKLLMTSNAADVEEVYNTANLRYDQQSTPNYSDYIVDNQIEHSLSEDFKHKRPFGFKFRSNIIIEAKTWKEVFIKTCEILYDIDSKKFNKFEDLKNMKGRRKKYFSKNQKDLRVPAQIRDNIYVETNHSANTLKDLIVKMLIEFNFEVSDYKVYFIADYVELNKENK